MRDGLSYRFTHALSRRPSASCVNGLRAMDVGVPDVELFQAQHSAYLDALANAGLSVTVLEPLEDYPDSVFVEDPALCLPEGAIVLRPGAASRRGESAEIAPTLKQAYGEVHEIQGLGFIDGGDIMVTDREILIGLSARTDREGVAALDNITQPWGYKIREVQTPTSVLHFKSDSAPLGGERVLATKRLAESGCFEGYDVLLIPDGEEAAANALRVNDQVFLASGFPETADLLSNAGYDLTLLPMTEAAKLDGGLSCLSLRFTSLSHN